MKTMTRCHHVGVDVVDGVKIWIDQSDRSTVSLLQDKSFLFSGLLLFIDEERL